MKNILNETKEHYKSYKAGKHWVYACLTVTTLGLGLLGSSVVAQADTTTTGDTTQTVDTEQVDATAKAQPSATTTLKTAPETTPVKDTTPAAVTTDPQTTAKPEMPAGTETSTKAPAETPATTTPETTTPETTTPAGTTPVSNQNKPETPTVEKPAATPAPKAAAAPVATPAVTPATGETDGTTANSAKAATDATATVKPEAEAEVDPTTDPNNAVNWMPDPAMRQWIEDTLTAQHTMLVNGVRKGTFVTDENLYQFVNDSFQLSDGTYQNQPNVTSLKGLERFTNLTALDVTNPKLTPAGMINFDFAPAMTSFRINNYETANLNWNLPLNDFLNTYLPQNTNLKFLSLDNLGLTGDLTGLVKYKDLTMVTLTQNKLTGTLPDLTQSKDMFELNLNHNQLSGTFDPTNLPSLSTLNISDNNFSGDFPDTGNIGFVAYAQNHFTSGLYHPQDEDYFHYEGWNQDLTTPDYTQGQAQAGINPFADAGVTSLQDTTTGDILSPKYSLISFGNLNSTPIIYSPTAPTNVKDYASWADWADQQTNARSWFKFTLSNTGQYKLTPVKALPGGYYVFRVAAYIGQYKDDNYSAFITSKIDEGTASTITVKNVDQQGNLISQQVLDGKVGDRITVNADNLANYKLVSTAATVNKIYTDAPQTVTFVYASTLGTVTVKEIAPDGTVLDQRTLTGTIDDAFTANAGKHYGYTLVGNPTVAGTYTEAPQTITFNYTNTQGTVTVQNVDTNGKVLDQKTLTGNVGDTFTTNADKLAGYTLTSAPTATGTYTEDPQTVTFVYAIAKGTVTVKNVDTNGNVLNQTTLTGNVGDTFTANAEKIYGYTLTSNPTATGTYTEDPQTVTFVYTIAKGTVTVKNVDTDGNVLNQHTLTGNVGDTFTANADTLDGYQVTGPATQTGTYTEVPQTVTFTFSQLPAAQGTVIVKNVDPDGNVLMQHTLTGKVGDTFTANADTLTGYQVTGPATQTGTYTAAPQTITFTLAKITTGGGGDIPATNGTVIVKNVDANGNVLSQHTLTGKVGDTFTANADTLTGYQVTGPATQSGTYAETPQTITFVFNKVTTDDNNGEGDQVTPTPTTPTKPTTPTTPTHGAQPAKAQPVTGAQNDQAARPANRAITPAVVTTASAAATVTPAPVATTHSAAAQPTKVPTTKLPQTNDQASVNPLVAGLTLLLATLGLGLKRKRNH
ncbi:MucBP domain-containing protein [Levilactobacillus acidifarinae]|uniref:Gram-positive cocci surface proteins LPxTG domain-containing protein n=1 Tax=Levilactobacillus acidifarinae DSM 19394 = JCM 15949 TaxID=1423715 RepID=A0A0R1LI87_9LACO|nr:MucBP domain-containing protein [Levilactobacillus acidifarinae]KRK95627.1 hypothetical protein FD25_GL000042 [Levilactobacillus acidifarinae DSM 19394]GEO69362.1 hypothetical protein LAC03_12720 [Levilactobacillus acidifarinae]